MNTLPCDFKEMLEYTLGEIELHPNEYYRMANKKYASMYLPYIQEKYPETVMIEIGISQYFATSSTAQKKLNQYVHQLTRKKEDELKKLYAVSDRLTGATR